MRISEDLLVGFILGILVGCIICALNYSVYEAGIKAGLESKVTLQGGN